MTWLLGARPQPPGIELAPAAVSFAIDCREAHCGLSAGYKTPSQHLAERRSISPLRSPYTPHDAEPVTPSRPVGLSYNKHWWQIPYLNGLLLAQNMDLDQVLGMLHRIETHTRRVQSLVEAGKMRDVKLNFGDCGFYLG